MEVGAALTAAEEYKAIDSRRLKPLRHVISTALHLHGEILLP
jgi:hypothetical protein